MKQLHHHPHFWIIIGIFVIDGLFFSVTNPDQVPSAMLIIGFLLFLLTAYLLASGFFQALRWYGIQISRPKRLARLTTLALGIIVALQSVGELGSRDVMVLVPLMALAYVYISYTRRPASE